MTNTDILLAKFPKGRQENECTLLLGTYVELVDREAVVKQKELLVNTVIGVLQTRSVSAVPQVEIDLSQCFTALLSWRQHFPAVC